jgi:hypothetical protein
MQGSAPWFLTNSLLGRAKLELESKHHCKHTGEDKKLHSLALPIEMLFKRFTSLLWK